MRFNEIKLLLKEDQDLLEVNMSPSNLEKLASQIDAQAGMEFEMIVPGVSGTDDDSELEPNYDDYDDTATDISAIADFFHDGDYNGRREINRLRERMESEYQDWVSEQVGDAWASEGKDLLREYIENNEFNRDDALEDAYDQLGLTSEQKEAANQAGATVTKLADTEGFEDWQNWKKATNMVEERLDELTEEAWDEMDGSYDGAFEEYSDSQREDFSEQDWLEAEGISYMSDVERQYEISWPHWTSAGGDGEVAIESVADRFGNSIGRKVNWSTSYHGGKREPNAYVVEPDGSLEPDDSDDAGLEFVSPPLALDDMLSDLDKVKAWADETGCYTNKSTGLHINVSVADFDLQKLDYVKLALLLGDQYVLDQFGRAGNNYAKSAMGMIKDRIAQRPEDAAAMLQQMKAGLGELATKVIHSGATSKFTSINTKTGYIEFRSPGGDWLSDEFFNKIKPTLLRFVVALDAAMDPQKYRDEYLKKLYAVLKPKDQNDTLSYFAKFAAGELPKTALKSFIRQAQLERSTKKTAPGSGAANYKIYSITDGRVMDTFYAADRTSAEDQFRDWLMSPEAGASDNFRYAPIDTVIRGEPGQPISGSTLDLQRQRAAQTPAAGTTWTGQWLVRDNRGNVLHSFGGIGNSQADANRVAAGWLARQGYQAGLEVDVVPEMR